MASPFSTGRSNAKRRILQVLVKGKGIMPAPPTTRKKCRTIQGGECLVDLGVCFQCGQPVHMIQECPQNAQGRRNAPKNWSNQRPLAQDCVYCITPEEIDKEIPEDEETRVITACSLFDSGAMRPFVSMAFVLACNLPTERLPQDVIVLILDRSTITCTRVLRNCLLSVNGRIMEADLIIFNLLGFDIILGMDWLSKHFARIDCRNKEIIFDPSEVGQICYM
ncbi:hypothetical protein F2P56_012422 [Juglans regia]|uniref:CCHC-type domain-containing protein n=2 Tax=Juglans regia TaxID=51240 RepID=A0A833XN38_JUGRE|nr:uncharacterized protein LOC108984622 [Juglans regia]KAF5468256.1 hypothetical protein F2P56_012422 [Juglans regia]